jgi:hypothetical protein
MFLCYEPTHYSVQSPCYDQVLTGILPYGDGDKDKVTNNIRHGKRPSRPTDPNQNQWLQDHIWDTITTCWSEKPQQRHKLSVVHHIFSMPSPQDTLVKFPPVDRKNLIQLADEFLNTFITLPLHPAGLAKLRAVQKYVYDVISGDRTPPSGMPAVEVAVLAETFREVPFPCQNLP